MPRNAEYILSPSDHPPPQLGPSANERAVSNDVAHSIRENLHHFLSVLLRGMLHLFSIMSHDSVCMMDGNEWVYNVKCHVIVVMMHFMHAVNKTSRQDVQCTDNPFFDLRNKKN